MSKKNLLSKLGKVLAGATLIASPFLGKAQTDASLGKFYGDQVLDATVSPNYQNQGKFTLDYYGSGDADKNDTLDIRDYEAIQNNVKNDRTDINLDGITNSSDLEMFEEYLKKQRKYFPAHWDLLQTKTERESTLKKLIGIDQTDKKTWIENDFDCDGFSEETILNFSGIEKIKNSGIYFDFIDTTNNMRFNIPMYRITTRTTNDVAHRIVGVLTGDSITKFSDWYFIEPQDDSKVVPGDFSMNKNEKVKIDRLVYAYSEIDKKNIHGYYPLAEFDLNNGVPSLNWVHPDAVKARKKIPLYFNEVTLPENIDIEYGHTTDKSRTGIPENIYENAWIEERDSSTQKMDGTYDQVNYDLYRYFKINNHELVDTTVGPQVIKVRYTKIYELPADTTIEYGSSIDTSITGIPHNVYEKALITYSDSSTQKMDGTKDQNNYEIYRTFKISNPEFPDDNITMGPQIIKLRDTESPEINLPENRVVNYGSDIDTSLMGVPEFTDNSNLPVGWNYSDSSTQNADYFKCGHYNYQVFRKFEGKDVSGNSVFGTQNISVENLTNDLIFIYFPADTTVVDLDDLSPNSLGWPVAKDTLVPEYNPGITYTDKTWILHDGREVIEREFKANGVCIEDLIKGYQNIISESTAVIENANNFNSLNVYPNPAGSSINLEGFIFKHEKINWKLYDINGRTLDMGSSHWNTGKNIENIDISDLEKGVYTLTFKAGDKVKHLKVLKQ